MPIGHCLNKRKLVWFVFWSKFCSCLTFLSIFYASYRFKVLILVTPRNSNLTIQSYRVEILGRIELMFFISLSRFLIQNPIVIIRWTWNCSTYDYEFGHNEEEHEKNILKVQSKKNISTETLRQLLLKLCQLEHTRISTSS